MKDFNEKLESWINTKPSTNAGINNIQIPGQPELLIWQTRYKVPTIYEQDFIQNLLSAFSTGNTELAHIVQALNAQDFRSESGAVWTEQSFTEEMQRLGY